MFGAIVDDCLKLEMEVLAPVDPQVAGALQDYENWRGNPLFHITPVADTRQLKPTLQTLAAKADQIVLIAPESAGILTDCVQWLKELRSKLVCGPESLIGICADKNACQKMLASRGVAVAAGVALPHPELVDAKDHFMAKGKALQGPLVIKPADGAGGEHVLLCGDADQLNAAWKTIEQSGGDWRMERYIEGRPISVSIVRSAAEVVLLPATEQCFSAGWHDWRDWQPPSLAQKSGKMPPQPIGHFVESVFPLAEDLQQRAEALAWQVADALPQWRGYLGVDMVLADTGPDVVVELNPRLTMSYHSIRRETGFNLIEFYNRCRKTGRGSV